MNPQTEIPVPPQQVELGPCRWCGEEPVGTVEVEKARYRNDRGVRVVAKVALEVPACKAHIGILNWQPKADQS